MPENKRGFHVLNPGTNDAELKVTHCKCYFGAWDQRLEKQELQVRTMILAGQHEDVLFLNHA